MAALKRHHHELIVRQYIRNGGNGSQAYWDASKACPGKPLVNKKSAAVCACRILSYPEVQARYKELQNQMAKRADITEDKILSDYQEALNMAKKQEKPADIVNAATAQAKLVGLLRDRQEIGEPGDFDDMENISDVIATVEAEEGPEAAAMLLAYASKRKTTQRPFNEVTEVSETSLVEAKPASDAVN